MPKVSHNMSRTPTYRVWVGMKRRCKADPKYKHVSVCPAWELSFMSFYNDMGVRPEGMTIDRIDGTKGYEPGNCRWATYKEQNRNLRTNHIVAGRTVSEIAESTGLSHTAVIYRAKHGLPVDAPRIGERTHCKAGHEWTEANTYVATVKRKQGGIRHQRFCRTCRAKHQAEARERKSNYTVITNRAELAWLNPKRTGE